VVTVADWQWWQSDTDTIVGITQTATQLSYMMSDLSAIRDGAAFQYYGSYNSNIVNIINK